MTSVVGPTEETSPSAVRVLVVDDDEALCRQLASGLAAAGYQVVTAHDGGGAVAQAVATPPDVVIVDLEMPTSGLEVIRFVKRRSGPAIHVMVMTGHDDEASRAEAFEAGTDDYVLKPASLAELRRRLAAATRTQRAFVDVRLEKEAADRRMTYGQEASALLAHDLNNGLVVALMNLSFLREVAPLSEDHRDALGATLESLRRMSGLVANFVDIARFEDAAVKPSVAVARVQPMLASVVKLNAAVLERGVRIAVECQADLEGRFDRALIERVLHNLVGNAMRYCDGDGAITLTARRWNDADSLELAVTNRGPQIPEAIRAQLFGKYARGSGGKRGMGLYFCRLVAEAHGGRIEYEAAPMGPRFALRLPGRA